MPESAMGRSTRIPLSRMPLDDSLREAALRALDSGNYILGKECALFEEELARYVGRRHAVLASSWTAGVHLLHISQDLRPGDEVILPSHTAFPTMEPLAHLGVKPVFADVDETYDIDPGHAESLVNRRTVGIIPVHLYGNPVDLGRLLPIARKHNLWVLEDCAQAHGASYRGPAGEGQVGSFGDFAAFSFFPSKNLTVFGDGGAILTDDDGLAERLRMLRNHGRRDKHTHEVLGFNLRFNEINAAIGRTILAKLDRLNDHRRLVAGLYNQELEGTVIIPREQKNCRHVYHQYVIRLPEDRGRLPEARDRLAAFLADRGIQTGIHYPIANHQQPATRRLFAERGWEIPTLPRTEALVGAILSLPIHGLLPLEDADFVARSIREFFAARGR